jgi:hypothetical protein
LSANLVNAFWNALEKVDQPELTEVVSEAMAVLRLLVRLPYSKLIQNYFSMPISNMCEIIQFWLSDMTEDVKRGHCSFEAACEAAL